jgi:hypothetical protein
MADADYHEVVAVNAIENHIATPREAHDQFAMIRVAV